MANGKDSAEVIKFLSLLGQIKNCCDDDPACLSELVVGDEGLKDLCVQLAWTASRLSVNERRHRQLFSAPVDPKFMAAWRDFEDRYEKLLAGIWLADILPGVGNADSEHTPKADLQWENADYDGVQQASAIEHAIEFTYETTRGDDELNEDFRESIEDAMAAWRSLKDNVGFDLRGVFRRRELVPFVLVPRHVAARHGGAESLSMLKNLQQAHDAFVFGAPFAALALMRSIMESALRDHYGADVKDLDLSERIRQASRHLPSGANAAALHRLRKLANTILHLGFEKDGSLTNIDANQLEKEIVSLLFVLRALIEGAPRWRAR